MTDKRRCRECGCDDEVACFGGCSWVEPDLCSACASELAEPEFPNLERRGFVMP